MKKIKISLSAIAFFIAIAGAFAFKPSTSTNLSGEQWFEFTNSQSDNDVNNPADYSLYGDGQTPPDCAGSITRCAVFVMPDSGTPSQPDATSLTNVNPDDPNQVKIKN